MPCSKQNLCENGDIGLGTLNVLDGEIASIDGEFYQVMSYGVAYPVQVNATTPFAILTHLDAGEVMTTQAGANVAGFEKQLDKHFLSKNVFYVLMVDGTFDYVKTRGVSW